jgi:hypothetical protein
LGVDVVVVKLVVVFGVDVVLIVELLGSWVLVSEEVGIIVGLVLDWAAVIVVVVVVAGVGFILNYKKINYF